MIERNIIRIGLFVLVTGCTFTSKPDTEEKTRQPNIIVIMADDLGFNDLGCYGNDRIKTPNIDNLAKKGIRFIDFHSNGAVCSPTRASLMTGKYQQKVGIEGVITAKNHRHIGLAINEITIADFLKKHKYKTGLIGKWHLGYDTLFSPVNNGFDYFKGYVSGNIDYHSHIDQVGYYDWWLNKDTLSEKGYSTDLITNTSIEFISKNINNPFFLYIAHESPHFPYQGRKDKADRKVNGQFKILGSRVDTKNAYKEMIEVMDEGIGYLFNYLEEQKLLSNTLILFFSDNGAASIGSNYPLRGNKASLWEGGHRVPAIAYWKDSIKPKTVNETVLTMDVFPTLVELVNPQFMEKYEFDGISFLSLLFSDIDQKDFLHRPLFWRFGDKKAVRLNNWKLLIIDNKEYLFNLHEDVMEMYNQIGKYPEMKDSLYNILNEWEMEIDKFEIKTD